MDSRIGGLTYVDSVVLGLCLRPVPTEGHRDPSRPRAGPLGDALTQTHGREGRLDRYLE